MGSLGGATPSSLATSPGAPSWGAPGAALLWGGYCTGSFPPEGHEVQVHHVVHVGNSVSAKYTTHCGTGAQSMPMMMIEDGSNPCLPAGRIQNADWPPSGGWKTW